MQFDFRIGAMQTMAVIPGYYTPEEAAHVLGVHVSQISRYVKAGDLKPIPVGRSMLFEQSDIHNFIRPQRGNPNFKRQKA